VERRGEWGLVDAVGRMFLCARCREPVVLCSRCDRGQRYCDQGCSSEARRGFQRDAGRRYQDGSTGRAKHAERSRRWRLRQKERGDPSTDEAGPVTHQGLLEGSSEAPGLPGKTEAKTVPTHHDFAIQTPWICPQCAEPLAPWVRQGFLRQHSIAAGRLLTRAGRSPPVVKAMVPSAI